MIRTTLLSKRQPLPSRRWITLHTEWLNQDLIKDSRPTTVFLHGLLGNGRNLKTLALKLERPALLVDLRGHGKSGGREEPTNFKECATDVSETLTALQITEFDLVGHSLGGRIAVEYLKNEMNPSPKRVWLLDTVPGKLDPTVQSVLELAERALTENLSRKEISHYFRQHLDPAMAQWLASSYDAKTHNYTFCLNVAKSLVQDFQHQQFLGDIIQSIDKVRIDMVRGTRNENWNNDEQHLHTLLELHDTQDSFGFHHVDAGHWVHVEDLPGLLQIMKE